MVHLVSDLRPAVGSADGWECRCAPGSCGALRHCCSLRCAVGLCAVLVAVVVLGNVLGLTFVDFLASDGPGISPKGNFFDPRWRAPERRGERPTALAMAQCVSFLPPCAVGGVRSTPIGIGPVSSISECMMCCNGSATPVSSTFVRPDTFETPPSRAPHRVGLIGSLHDRTQSTDSHANGLSA